MAKCKWCGEISSVNKHGYCDTCNQKIRNDIVQQKAQLEDLAKQARIDLPADDKQKIIDEALKYRSALSVYKEKNVPFFTSDIDAMCETVYAKLGIPYQFQRKAYVPKSLKITKILLGCAAVVLFISMAIDGEAKKKTIEDLGARLDATNIIVEAQSIQIDELQAMIKELKGPKTVRRSFTLQNGNFVSGKDFDPGTYDIKAVFGGGNVYSDNVFDGGINAIMGIDGDPSFYQREYKNVSLPEGTAITVDDVKIKLTLAD